MRRVLSVVVLTATVAAAGGSAAPPGTRIVFAAVASSLRIPSEPATLGYLSDLASIGPNGSRRRPLTRTRTWEDDPAWSPDRRRLAFTRGTPVCHAATCTGSNDSAVWVAFASGAPARPLTRPAAFHADRAPAWSPDGRSLAFIRERPTDDSDLDGVYIVDALGRGLRKLVDTRARTEQIAWSPDGSTIAVGLVSYGLVLVDVRTGAITSVAATRSRTELDAVAWSPDGRLLAFADAAAEGIYVVPAAGAGGPRRLATARWVSGISWSPDGRRLAFAGWRPALGGARSFSPPTALFVVGADGRGLRRLTETRAQAYSPSWC